MFQIRYSVISGQVTHITIQNGPQILNPICLVYPVSLYVTVSFPLLDTIHCPILDFCSSRQELWNVFKEGIVMIHRSIHPLSIPLIHWGLWWWLEPNPADIGREAAYTLNWSPAHHRANIQRQTTSYTYNQFKVSNLPQPNVQYMILDCGREPDYLEETPHKKTRPITGNHPAVR